MNTSSSLSVAQIHQNRTTIVNEDALARALRDVNLVSVIKFTLKPEKESVVTALLAGGANSSTCAYGKRGKLV